MRVMSVINNPHLTDWFFTSKVSDFVQSWLHDVLDADWYWLRYEYQARGSTHAHGCAKLKNDSGLCHLVETAARGWLEERALNDAVKNHANLPNNNHIILFGQHAKSQAIAYANWLVTTINHSIPDETWRPAHPHPCAMSSDSYQIKVMRTTIH